MSDDNAIPFDARARAARKAAAANTGPRGPFDLVLAGRRVRAVRDELATHGWRFYEDRLDDVLGGTKPVEVPPPSYAAVMDALTERA
jgi:hypothetical protein